MRIVAVAVLAPLALACSSPDPRIAAVEIGIPAVTIDGKPVELSLAKWMDTLGVPGVSIAVIDNFRIVWAKGYGTMTAGDSTTPITPTTIFQAASIAKPVTALALLHHADRGTFELDADIRTVMRSWTLPAAGADSGAPVTIRQLLAHTAGVRAGGFVGYDAGTPLPTTAQILDGAEPALNSPAIIEQRPGTAVTYSGLGYLMLQLALVDRLQLPFDSIMAETVFRPMNMTSSTFAQELPAPLAARAARGHLSSGAMVPGGWQRYPELAAAGLWTTPSDLARMMIGISIAWTGRPGGVLSPEATKRMLTPELDRMGLGFVVRPGDTLGFFSHSGGNQGYRAHFEMISRFGKGVVVMTNSDVGHPLSALITLAVARAYGWPDTAERKVSESHPDMLAAQIAGAGKVRIRVPAAPATLARYVGRYELAPGFEFKVNADSARGRLLIELGDQGRLPAYPASDREFFFEAVDAQITFVSDGSSRVTGLLLHQGGRTQEAKRLD